MVIEDASSFQDDDDSDDPGADTGTQISTDVFRKLKYLQMFIAALTATGLPTGSVGISQAHSHRRTI